MTDYILLSSELVKTLIESLLALSAAIVVAFQSSSIELYTASLQHTPLSSASTTNSQWS